MSVLIKDMEKPKSCYTVIDEEYEYCPFVNTDDDCVLLLEKGICEGTWADQYSKCPLAEEPERKKGKWIDDGTELGCCCSECGVTLDDYFYGALYEVRLGKMPNFCPNCGSKMEV